MDGPIHIVLPVHNRCSVTNRFIDCLVAQSDQHFRLLLIDDGCVDDTVAVVRARVPEVTVVAGDGNLWWAGAVQAGLDWLTRSGIPGEQIVLIANDDTSFDSGFLQDARRYLELHRNVLLQAVPVDPASGMAIDHGTVIDWPRFRMYPAQDDGQIDALSSRCLFSRLVDLFTIGGFRPRLLPHYFSDYEFTIRARKRGLRLATSDSVRVTVSPATSGVLTTQGLPLKEFAKVAFSRRHSYNPVYFSIFIVMAAPLRHIPLSLLRVWALFGLALARAAKVSLSKPRSKDSFQ